MQIGRYAPRLRNQGCELVALSNLSTRVKAAASPIIVLRHVVDKGSENKDASKTDRAKRLIKSGSDLSRAFHIAPGGELGRSISLDKVLSHWPSEATVFISIDPGARGIAPHEFRAAIENLSRQYRCRLVPVFPVSEAATLAEPSLFGSEGPIAIEMGYIEARNVALGKSPTERDALRRLNGASPDLITVVDFADACEAHCLDISSTIEWFGKLLSDIGVRRVVLAGNSAKKPPKDRAFRPVSIPRYDKRLFDLLKGEFRGTIVARSDSTCLPPGFEDKAVPLKKFRGFIRGIQARSHVTVPGLPADAEGRRRQFPALIETYLRFVDPQSKLDCVGLRRYLMRSIRTPQQALAAAMVIYMTHGVAEQHSLGLLGQPFARQLNTVAEVRSDPAEQPSLPFGLPEKS